MRVGLRIMPSANTEENIVVMKYMKNTEDEDAGGNVDKSYHVFSDTESYFPSLRLKKEYVPFGDPDPYCLHLSWSPVDKSNMIDKYQPFVGMNRCSLINKGHTVWHKDDPKEGIDIKMWRQDTFQLDNCGTECEYQCESKYRGIYKFGKCYSYSIVDGICFKVSEESGSKNSEDYSWKIETGCYDGKYTKMIKAVPGFEYNFAHVPIEVRADADPFAGKTEEEDKEAEDPSRNKGSFSFWGFLMWIAFLVFIISFILWLFLTCVDIIKTNHDQEEARQLVKERANL